MKELILDRMKGGMEGIVRACVRVCLVIFDFLWLLLCVQVLSHIQTEFSGHN